METKVLIITYYWPPSGGSGVQRWLKFVKYLPSFGVKPYVYTVENGEFPILDETLQNDVPKEAVIIKKPIWEPYGFYKKISGQKNKKIAHGFVSEKKSTIKKLVHGVSVFVRGNFFIPDARKFWVKPSAKFLEDYIKENKIDIIISTGPPHSMHLIALKLKQKCNVKWIADFRDPWTGVYYLSEMKLTGLAFNKHRKMENDVLLNADSIVTIGPNLKLNLAKLINQKDISSKISIIPNGFDFEYNSAPSDNLDKEFSIVYLGLFSKEQNHPAFWKALNELCSEDEVFKSKLKIRLVGKIDSSIEQEIELNGLTSVYEKLDYVPHHEVRKMQRNSQVLLLSINRYPNAKEMLTGKLFEYIGSNRPILCLGPTDGDAAAIINETKTGYVCNWDDIKAMKDCLKKMFAAYQNNELTIHPINVENYSRKNLTRKLVEILNQLTNK